MKKSNRQKHNFADVLATELQFAVLTKPGRVQILVHPTAKQLRRRGKRGWRLFGSVDDDPNSEKTLDEIVKEAIAAVETEDADKDQRANGLTTAADE